MLDLEAVRRAHTRDMAEVLNRATLASDNEWTRPTPCGNWTVGDLVAHLAAGQACRAEALRRMQAGVDEPAPVPEIRGHREAVVEALRTYHEEVEAELAGLTPDGMERPVQMAFGPLPLHLALQIFVMEAGVHAQDIQMAMSGQAVLTPDVIDATASVLTTVLKRGEEPAGPVAYRLVSPNIDLSFTWRDGQWMHEPDDNACVIEGDDNVVLLFALGRIDAEDPAVYATDQDAARRFKDYFPGP